MFSSLQGLILIIYIILENHSFYLDIQIYLRGNFRSRLFWSSFASVAISPYLFLLFSLVPPPPTFPPPSLCQETTVGGWRASDSRRRAAGLVLCSWLGWSDSSPVLCCAGWGTVSLLMEGGPWVMFGAGIFLSLAPELGRLEKLLPGDAEESWGVTIHLGSALFHFILLSLYYGEFQTYVKVDRVI